MVGVRSNDSAVCSAQMWCGFVICGGVYGRCSLRRGPLFVNVVVLLAF